MFLVPRDSLVHWGSKQARYLCPAGFLDTTRLHPGRIFLVFFIYIFCCLFVSLDIFIFVMFLMPRNSLVHWGSKCVTNVQQVFLIQQGSTLVRWIFLFFPCLYLLVCLSRLHSAHPFTERVLFQWIILCIGDLSKCVIYVQQVFLIQ